MHQFLWMLSFLLTTSNYLLFLDQPSMRGALSKISSSNKSPQLSCCEGCLHFNTPHTFFHTEPLPLSEEEKITMAISTTNPVTTPPTNPTMPTSKKRLLGPNSRVWSGKPVWHCQWLHHPPCSSNKSEDPQLGLNVLMVGTHPTLRLWMPYMNVVTMMSFPT